MTDLEVVPNTVDADWNAMTCGGGLRFCERCQKTVFNRSQSKSAITVDLSRTSDEKLCERYISGDAGAILKADYPVGCPERFRDRLRWIRKLIKRCILLAFAFVIFALYVMYRPPSEVSLRINQTNFDRIESGMTKQEVEEIFGCPPGNYSHSRSASSYFYACGRACG